MRRKAYPYLLLLFCFLGLCPGPLEGQEIKRGEVTVRHERLQRSAAEEILAIYPVVKSDLERRLGFPVKGDLLIVLIARRETFERLSGNSRFVAFAVPRQNLVLIDYSRMKVQPFILETTLSHELCHLALHGHITGGNLPKWIDEGVCQWASGGMTEIFIDHPGSALKEATLSRSLIPIGRLGVGFPNDEKGLILAYEQSKSLIEYVVTRFGASGLLAVLYNLRDGHEADAAIEQATSLSLEELEKRWHLSLTEKVTWFTYFVDHLYEILFLIAGLATLYGFVKVMRRRKLYRDEDADEGDLSDSGERHSGEKDPPERRDGP